MRKPKTKTSKYRGVSAQGRKWRASITTDDKKTHYLGLFRVEEDAAREYDRKALELIGKDAKLNFPEAL